MAAKDPFANIQNIDESNYLTIKIESLKSNARPEPFNNAIDNLVEVRDVLRIAQRASMIQNIGGRSWYQDSLNWLRGITPLGIWISVPQLTSGIDGISVDVASLFEQHMQQLLNNIRTDPSFQQIQIAKSVADSTTKQSIIKARDEASREYEAELETKSADAQNQLQSRSQEVNQQVDQRFANISNQINDVVTNAINEIQQARVLESWGQEYDTEIKALEEKIYGENLPRGTMIRNLRSISRYTYSKAWIPKWDSSELPYINLGRALVHFIKLGLRIMSISFSNLLTILRVTLSKLISINSQRVTAFIFLAGFAILFAASSFIAVHDVKNVFGVSTEFLTAGNTADYIAKLSVYLPVVILLGIAYSFAVKDYRIYANMLDQYKHRRVVANTSKGVILSLREDGDSNVRDNIAAAAAQALFEHRVTGHLSKKEAESLSILELFKSIR
ncbi:MAG: hypothetical protein Q7T56_19710 [Nocardioidaceae bacterium]|nr:hypothetical protein [Nocardioidaceae bacterium]